MGGRDCFDVNAAIHDTDLASLTRKISGRGTILVVWCARSLSSCVPSAHCMRYNSGCRFHALYALLVRVCVYLRFSVKLRQGPPKKSRCRQFEIALGHTAYKHHIETHKGIVTHACMDHGLRGAVHACARPFHPTTCLPLPTCKVFCSRSKNKMQKIGNLEDVRQHIFFVFVVEERNPSVIGLG
jgi:hypothetical protein